MSAKKIAAIVAAIVAAVVLALFLWPSGGGAPKDNDKASDCWAHADKFGSRHCDTRPGS